MSVRYYINTAVTRILSLFEIGNVFSITPFFTENDLQVDLIGWFQASEMQDGATIFDWSPEAEIVSEQTRILTVTGQSDFNIDTAILDYGTN